MATATAKSDNTPRPKSQRVSNWVATGSHTFCPNCNSPRVNVAYFVYDDDTKGWEYQCAECGSSGAAKMREKHGE